MSHLDLRLNDLANKASLDECMQGMVNLADPGSLLKNRTFLRRVFALPCDDFVAFCGRHTAATAKLCTRLALAGARGTENCHAQLLCDEIVEKNLYQSLHMPVTTFLPGMCMKHLVEYCEKTNTTIPASRMKEYEHSIDSKLLEAVAEAKTVFTTIRENYARGDSTNNTSLRLPVLTNDVPARLRALNVPVTDAVVLGAVHGLNRGLMTVYGVQPVVAAYSAYETLYNPKVKSTSARDDRCCNPVYEVLRGKNGPNNNDEILNSPTKTADYVESVLPLMDVNFRRLAARAILVEEIRDRGLDSTCSNAYTLLMRAINAVNRVLRPELCADHTLLGNINVDQTDPVKTLVDINHSIQLTHGDEMTEYYDLAYDIMEEKAQAAGLILPSMQAFLAAVSRSSGVMNHRFGDWLVGRAACTPTPITAETVANLVAQGTFEPLSMLPTSVLVTKTTTPIKIGRPAAANVVFSRSIECTIDGPIMVGAEALINRMKGVANTERRKIADSFYNYAGLLLADLEPRVGYYLRDGVETDRVTAIINTVTAAIRTDLTVPEPCINVPHIKSHLPMLAAHCAPATIRPLVEAAITTQLVQSAGINGGVTYLVSLCKNIIQLGETDDVFERADAIFNLGFDFLVSAVGHWNLSNINLYFPSAVTTVNQPRIKFLSEALVRLQRLAIISDSLMQPIRPEDLRKKPTSSTVKTLIERRTVISKDTSDLDEYKRLGHLVDVCNACPVTHAVKVVDRYIKAANAGLLASKTTTTCNGLETLRPICHNNIHSNDYTYTRLIPSFTVNVHLPDGTRIKDETAKEICKADIYSVVAGKTTTSTLYALLPQCFRAAVDAAARAHTFARANTTSTSNAWFGANMAQEFAMAFSDAITVTSSVVSTASQLTALKADLHVSTVVSSTVNEIAKRYCQERTKLTFGNVTAADFAPTAIFSSDVMTIVDNSILPMSLIKAMRFLETGKTHHSLEYQMNLFSVRAKLVLDICLAGAADAKALDDDFAAKSQAARDSDATIEVFREYAEIANSSSGVMNSITHFAGLPTVFCMAVVLAKLMRDTLTPEQMVDVIRVLVHIYCKNRASYTRGTHMYDLIRYTAVFACKDTDVLRTMCTMLISHIPSQFTPIFRLATSVFGLKQMSAVGLAIIGGRGIPAGVVSGIMQTVLSEFSSADDAVERLGHVGDEPVGIAKFIVGMREPVRASMLGRISQMLQYRTVVRGDVCNRLVELILMQTMKSNEVCPYLSNALEVALGTCEPDLFEPYAAALYARGTNQSDTDSLYRCLSTTKHLSGDKSRDIMKEYFTTWMAGTNNPTIIQPQTVLEAAITHAQAANIIECITKLMVEQISVFIAEVRKNMFTYSMHTMLDQRGDRTANTRLYDIMNMIYDIIRNNSNDHTKFVHLVGLVRGLAPFAQAVDTTPEFNDTQFILTPVSAQYSAIRRLYIITNAADEIERAQTFTIPQNVLVFEVANKVTDNGETAETIRKLPLVLLFAGLTISTFGQDFKKFSNVCPAIFDRIMETGASRVVAMRVMSTIIMEDTRNQPKTSVFLPLFH